MIQRVSSFLRTWALVAGLLFAARTMAPAAVTNVPPATIVTGAEQFLFLTLRYRTGEVSVVETRVLPGSLKTPRDSTQPGALVIRLEKGDGSRVWANVIDDPARQRLEYDDPAEPGVMRVKEIVADEVEFIVRTPLVAGAQQLTVYRAATNSSPQQLVVEPSASQLLLKYPLPAEAIR